MSSRVKQVKLVFSWVKSVSKNGLGPSEEAGGSNPFQVMQRAANNLCSFSEASGSEVSDGPSMDLQDAT